MSSTSTANPSHRPRIPGPISSGVSFMVLLLAAACGRSVPPTDRPDEVLRAQLGLTDKDEVHRVTLTGGSTEVLSPVQTTVPVGAWVEFVAGDGRVHQVSFEADSLGIEARAFLERTDQMASPPLVNKGQRFVVSFRDAPEGRYPFRAEGNGGPTRGVVVVLAKR
jgi:plastocyanin